ncbi:YbaB/EbfC family nucleoid-associated protein [Nocardia zapadnayensis]|uniref:YbaB/EbfC family nucleoid-associated protein n=1 Tax=Nocardia rhamnosiphila TaxID=426716 RepID=UPI002247CCD7|nr:YbaB/EbfC family nucleoid-associated protein [Nocardia zapadnayensis]MCX0274212.1 YbaB/EbfC family nucleoid-associated protein [Nocardia zapadnayensis]
MDQRELEGLRSAANRLRNHVEHLLDSFERQQPLLSEAFRQLEATRLQAHSPDRSIEVTIDTGGALTDLTLTTSALRKSPEALAHAIVEVVQQAAVCAREHNEAIVAGVAGDLGDMLDLPDIVPGTPSLRDIRAFLRNGG